MPLILKRPRFDPLAVKLRQLQSGKARRAGSDAIRVTFAALVDETFKRRADPEGNPWAARVPPTGTWPLLEKSGKMRKQYAVTATATGVRLDNARPYSKSHQTGRPGMAARRVAPLGALPDAWRDRIDAAITEALDEL